MIKNIIHNKIHCFNGSIDKEAKEEIKEPKIEKRS